MPNSSHSTTSAPIWLDTPDRYGLVSRALHWIMAALLIWQFIGIMGWRMLGQSETMLLIASVTPSHGTVGILTLCLVVLRSLWALRSSKQRPPHGRGLAGQLARLTHRLFYVAMFAIPALALMRSYGNGRGFNLWGLQLVPSGERKIDWMIAPADALHSSLAWGLCALIVLHIMAALMHGFVRRDQVLARMAGPVRQVQPT